MNTRKAGTVAILIAAFAVWQWSTTGLDRFVILAIVSPFTALIRMITS